MTTFKWFVCLLGASADQSLANKNGETALAVASLHGRIEVVRLLQDAGVDETSAVICWVTLP